MNEAVEFNAEIKQVVSRKTPSLDMEYKLVLVSDDPTINTLGLLAADTLVQVKVEVVRG